MQGVNLTAHHER